MNSIRGLVFERFAEKYNSTQFTYTLILTKRKKLNYLFVNYDYRNQFYFQMSIEKHKQ
jgi:hypothetical protein